MQNKNIAEKNIAEIDTSALRENYETVARMIRARIIRREENEPKIIAVVKANAYGHDVNICVPTLLQAGCDFFAVSSEQEALDVRTIGIKENREPNVLILGTIIPENAPLMAQNHVMCTVVSAEQAAQLSAAMREAGSDTAPLSVHVKLNTGMNRIGFPTDDGTLSDTVREIEEIAKDPYLKIDGIFTHFSCADDELLDHRMVKGYDSTNGYTGMQLQRFRTAVDLLRERGVDVGMVHASNSAAILGLPEAHFDAVRAGIVLYGYAPNGVVTGDYKPVMEFDSMITQIHHVKKGDAVGYGATFFADRDLVAATVSAGYGDGFERSYGGCTVEVCGKHYRQIGRICMDQFVIDVTPEEGEILGVSVGDKVKLFGGDDGTSLEDLARRSGTISYEVLCRISARVPRIKK